MPRYEVQQQVTLETPWNLQTDAADTGMVAGLVLPQSGAKLET